MTGRVLRDLDAGASCSPRATHQGQVRSLTATSDPSWEHGSQVRIGFPSWQCGFDSRHPLHTRKALQHRRIRVFTLAGQRSFAPEHGTRAITACHYRSWRVPLV